MFSRMNGRRLSIKSDATISLDEMLRRGVRAQPDVSALASSDGKNIAVLLWHYHDDDVPGATANVELVLNGLPAANIRRPQVQHFRIDENHSNAFSAWKKMGSPQQPTAEQYAALERAGNLTPRNAPTSFDGAKMKIELPRQAVSLVLLQF
jgi:xylan 1,4-beta-xylosidase